jgi:hypothetical protein
VIAQKRVRADKERPESSRIAEDREKAVRDDHDHPKTPMIEKKRSAPIRNAQNR